VQNQHQKYPTIRYQEEKLAGWDLPRNHFETNISNFFEPQPEEIPEVKYPQSYQAMFGGTPGTVHMNKEGVEFIYFNHGSKAFERVKISPAHAHMVIPTERKDPVQPQKSAQQPTLGILVQTAPLRQSTPLQLVLTPANTMAHTRSPPQQPINQGVARQLAIPQVDPTHVLQMLLNQLVISSQLNLQLLAPSAGQPIGQIPPVMGQSNTQGSFEARTSTSPNPQPRNSKDQHPETPSPEMQAIEQVSAELKSHVKQELVDHFSEMLQKQYGIKPKEQSCMFRTPYPSGYDQIQFLPRFKVPDFTKLFGQDETSTMEHITRFIIQCGEAGNVDALRIRLFSSSLLCPTFS
jgi:hypothetical protein